MNTVVDSGIGWNVVKAHVTFPIVDTDTETYRILYIPENL